MKNKEVTSPECIRCNQCVLDCPKNGALNINFRKTLKPSLVMVMVFVLFFSTILGFKLSNNFKVLPKPIASGTTIKLSDVKGYMTIEVGIKITGLTKDDFYKELSIPNNVPSNTKMKEISSVVKDFR